MIAGCGGSSHTTPTATSNTSSASATTASSTTSVPTSPTSTAVPVGAVAVAGGAPITHAVFTHWLFVAAKSQAGGKSAPSIVPSDPPRFTRCIAQVRHKLPALSRTPAARIRIDCAQLFATLNGQVMDFLIKARWYEAQAARLRIRPRMAAVTRALATERKRQFHTGAAYRAFLKQSGQTTANLRFRVRLDQIVRKLVARQTGSQAARAKALDRQLTRRYRSSTRCSPQYLMADCADYHAPA